jgi:hypothetical protein
MLSYRISVKTTIIGGTWSQPTAFNNIDIFVTNADEKQMKMKMVVTADYGNHK